MLGLADAMLQGPASTLVHLGRGRVAGGLDLLGRKVQVGDGLHQLGLGLLQQPVDVLGAVLRQAGPLLLPVALGRLRTRGGAVR